MTIRKLRLTRQEAAADLGLSVATLDRRIAEGLIHVVRDGRRVFVLASEVERYARGDN